jgi:hypothetical protein
MDIQTVLILMLVAFIIGLVMGVTINRPVIHT